MTDIPHAEHAQAHAHWWAFWHNPIAETNARKTSIWAAAAIDIYLIVLFGPLHNYAPDNQFWAEIFWVVFVALFTVYAILQQWTLAKQTGTGQETIAGWDKLFAISPVGVLVISETVWIVSSVALLEMLIPTWRFHVVAFVFAIYGVYDYFTTDVTNMRLRGLALSTRPAGT